MNTLVAEVVLLIVMGGMALLTIRTSVLRLAIVYMGVFSLAASLLYVLYRAPDVAIAEAVIGSGLVALLYLSALKRYRVYTIGLVRHHPENITDREIIQAEHNAAIRDIEQFCIEREREPQTVFTRETVEQAIANYHYDLVIEERDGRVRLYGHRDNYLVDELEVLFAMRDRDMELEVVRYDEGGLP